MLSGFYIFASVWQSSVTLAGLFGCTALTQTQGQSMREGLFSVCPSPTMTLLFCLISLLCQRNPPPPQMMQRSFVQTPKQIYVHKNVMTRNSRYNNNRLERSNKRQPARLSRPLHWPHCDVDDFYYCCSLKFPCFARFLDHMLLRPEHLAGVLSRSSAAGPIVLIARTVGGRVKERSEQEWGKQNVPASDKKSASRGRCWHERNWTAQFLNDGN